MKRIMVLLLVLVLIVFPIVAHAQGAGGDVDTAPTPEFQAALVGFVSMLVVQGLKSLSTFLARYPSMAWIEISGFGSVLTNFIVTGLMFYIQAGLAIAPGSIAPLFPPLWTFLVGLMTSYGAYWTVTKLSGAPTRAADIKAAASIDRA